MHVVACLLTVLNQSITLLMIKPKMCCMQESFRRHDDTRVASLRVPYILEMWKCNHMFSLQSFCMQAAIETEGLCKYEDWPEREMYLNYIYILFESK